MRLARGREPCPDQGRSKLERERGSKQYLYGPTLPNASALKNRCVCVFDLYQRRVAYSERPLGRVAHFRFRPTAGGISWKSDECSSRNVEGVIFSADISRHTYPHERHRATTRDEFVTAGILFSSHRAVRAMIKLLFAAASRGRSPQRLFTVSCLIVDKHDALPPWYFTAPRPHAS